MITIVLQYIVLLGMYLLKRPFSKIDAILAKNHQLSVLHTQIELESKSSLSGCCGYHSGTLFTKLFFLRNCQKG